MSSVYPVSGPPASWRTIIKYEVLAFVVAALAVAIFAGVRL